MAPAPPWPPRRRRAATAAALAAAAALALLEAKAAPRTPLQPLFVGRPAVAGNAESSQVQGIEFYTMDMCPYAQRTWIALEEKGLPYARKLVNLRNQSERDWYESNINPLGKVPSIRDMSDGTVLYESEIVNEYLEQKFAGQGPALMPGDAAGCAAVRLWNHHLNNKLAPAHFTFLMNKDPETEDDKRKALVEALQYYEDKLVGPYLVGEMFTLADVNALPFFERLVFSCQRFKGFVIPKSMKRLHAWLDAAMQRPSFLATKRPEDKLEELYQRFVSADYKFGGLNRN